MGSWHRENPELIGTSADPWMMHGSYRDSLRFVERECQECGRWSKGLDDRGLCPRCALGDEDA